MASRIARTIFFVHDETIILIHGFIKKTRATPEQELDLTRKRKRNYEQAQVSPPRK
jgi:phage-related protein